MNTYMITKLIIKDWHLFKGYMLGYALLGIISAGLMTAPSSGVYYLGVVGLITVLIGSSAHLAIVSVVTEKKEHQLSFIMALPVSPMDYALSKMLGGLTIYLVSWGIIVTATILIIYFSHMPNGMLPMLIICALEILVATTILLCAGVLSGSVPVTIVVMIILNLFFNMFMFAVAGIEAIGSHIESPTAIFNSTVFNLIGAELLAIAIVISTTIFIKSRKACFL
jgi:ABC-2 type transport system permease protein